LEVSVSKEFRNYRDLKVWVRAMEVVESIYSICKHFPDHEKFGLRSQMQRAATSIPSNIAEGQGRQHTKEFIQMLYVARGSLSELDTQLELAVRLNYCSQKLQSEALVGVNEVGRMLNGLIRSLRTRAG
jgi:four helix bundle protein